MLSMRMRDVRPALAIIATALALFLLPLALAPRAEAYVYWSNTAFDPGASAIGRANLDGTGVNQSFITGATTIRSASRSTPATSTGRTPRTERDRSRQPRRHRRRPELHHRAHDHSVSASRSTPATSTGRTSATSDTIGRANLDGTGVEPELHHRRRLPDRRRGRRQPRLLDELRHGTRSAAPTSTARAVNESFISRPHDAVARRRGRSPSRTSTGTNHRPRARSAAPTSTAPASNAELHHRDVLAAGDVAVDASHVYWTSVAGARHWAHRPRQPRRHGRRRESSSAAVSYPSGVAVDALPDFAAAATVDAKQDPEATGQEDPPSRSRSRPKELLTAEASGKIKVNPTYKLKPKTVRGRGGQDRDAEAEAEEEGAGKEDRRGAQGGRQGEGHDRGRAHRPGREQRLRTAEGEAEAGLNSARPPFRAFNTPVCGSERPSRAEEAGSFGLRVPATPQLGPK